MTRDGFVKLNEREEEAGREPFANPRNAAAGSLKLLDSKEVVNRPLDIVIYNAGGTGCEGFSTHSEMIKAFRDWGFPVTPWSKTCATMEDVYAAIDELETLRHTFRFEIDGAVVKLNERSLYDVLGATAHGPRWARAYKYAPERAETVVEGITVQVGRTGVLTPVAELRPVELAGSTISRATLHNADQVERQDIRIGDHVWLVKAGDVIPAIESSIPEKRTGVEKVFVMPSACPVCGGEVQRVDGEVALRCVNPACSAQLLRRVEHFASRNALDIRALGGTAISALVEQGWISDPLDLFSLSKERLESLEIAGRKFGKNAGSVVKALDESRKMPLERWLFATGIPGVGTTVAADIAAEHVHMADLAGSPVPKNVIDNDSLKGKDRKILPIKVEAAKAVLKFFDGEYGRRYLARLQELGIDPKSAPKAKVATDGPLVGAGCVLTGTLSRPRGEYAEMIRLAGGNVQGSVSSKTRYLIAGANTGAAKTSKARELGTEVIDEARLVELLGDIAKQGTAPEAQPEIQGNENSPSTSGVLEQGLLF
jgi:DNA ligase (NAD+)